MEGGLETQGCIHEIIEGAKHSDTRIREIVPLQAMICNYTSEAKNLDGITLEKAM